MTRKSNICPVCNQPYLRIKRIGIAGNHFAIFYVHRDLPLQAGQTESFEGCSSDAKTGERTQERQYKAGAKVRRRPGPKPRPCPVCGEFYLRIKRLGNEHGHLIVVYIHEDLPTPPRLLEHYRYCRRDTETGTTSQGIEQRPRKAAV